MKNSGHSLSGSPTRLVTLRRWKKRFALVNFRFFNDFAISSTLSNFQITQDSDLSNFMIELSGFLKELQCGYEIFYHDSNINNRMPTLESRNLLVEFLIAELMTQKMILKTQKPKDKSSVITIVSFLMKTYIRTNNNKYF